MPNVREVVEDVEPCVLRGVGPGPQEVRGVDFGLGVEGRSWDARGVDVGP